MPLEETIEIIITFLYKNIPTIDKLNIIKDQVNNDDQFTMKTAIPQDKLLDLVNLVLRTLGTLLIVLQWEDQHLQPRQKFISKLMNKMQYLWNYPLQKFTNDLLMTFNPF